jgi:hypothetical protein
MALDDFVLSTILGGLKSPQRRRQLVGYFRTYVASDEGRWMLAELADAVLKVIGSLSRVREESRVLVSKNIREVKKETVGRTAASRHTSGPIGAMSADPARFASDLRGTFDTAIDGFTTPAKRGGRMAGRKKPPAPKHRPRGGSGRRS